MTKPVSKLKITVKDLKGLTKAIQEPLLVYQWGAKHPATIIITEITTADGRKIAVGIRVENKGTNLSVNEIATIHRKTDSRLLEDFLKATPKELRDEKLKWVENEKVLNWLGMVPPKGTTLTDPKLLDVTKVIQEFQNPKISEEKSHISANRMQPVSKKTWTKLINWLKKTKLAKDVIIDKAFNEQTQAQTFKNSKGKVYGFVTSDGVIYLNPDLIMPTL